jgi:DNA-binding MarR family transcriptional regulator
MDLAPEAAEAVDQPAQGAEEAGDLLALERQVCFALSIAARSVLSVYRPVLEPLGLTHPQYLVMLALWGRSPVTVKELGEVLQLDAPTLSPLLKRLEAAGLVTRTRVPEDERQLRIELTGRGRDLRDEALNVPPTIIARLGMEPSELREVHRVLTALNESARHAGVEPLPSPAEGGV